MSEKEFQDMYMLLSESIENGYNYKNVLVMVKEQYNVSDENLVKIEKLMREHVWEDDNQYKKFKIDLRSIKL